MGHFPNSGSGGGGGSGTVTSVAATDASIVVSGTPTVTPTIATGTLDVIAAQHPPVAAVAMNAQKITGLANGTVSTDVAAFGQVGVTSLTAADTSIVVAGTAGAPTVATGTLDVIAAQHPPAADWSNNSHAITSVSDLAVSGLTGATAASRYVGATASGLPTSGTFAVGDLVIDQTGASWIATIAGAAPTNGQFRRMGDSAYQFRPESYGAVGNGKIVPDGAITSGAAILTTPGLSAPSAPVPTNSGTGGTVLAGTYQVEVTYVNANGETTASSAGSTTTSGSTSTITIPSPAASGSAVAWFAYVTQANLSTFTRQQNPSLPTPIGTNLVITAPPTSTGANPPGANTSASNPFTAADVGKSIHVGGAGGNTKTPLCTTILSFQSSGQVTLNANATSTVTAGITAWATDDTAAINSAVTAAVAYAQAHNDSAEVVFNPVIYGIGTAPTIGGTTFGNAQVPLPVCNVAAPKVVLTFRGTRDQTILSHFTQGTAQASGSTLMCLRNDGTVNATFGPSHIIGGPFSGFANGTSNFSNMKVVIDGITTLTPWNGTYGGIDLIGLAEARVISGSHMSLAVPGANGPTPSMGTASQIANFGFYGLRMPSTNNNAVCTIDTYTAEGSSEGVGVSEHTSWNYMEVNYCFNAVLAYGGANLTGGIAHWIHGKHLVAGECQNMLLVNASSGNMKIDIDLMSVENVGSKVISDASNTGIGVVKYSQINGSAGFTGAANLKLVNMALNPGLWGSPPAVPATTVAVAASALPFRDAWVNIQPNGATIASISVGGTVVTGVTSGWVFVPALAQTSISISYTVATPTWQWFLM